MNKNIWYRNKDAIDAIAPVCLTLDNCLTRGDKYSAVFAQGLFQLANAVTRLYPSTYTQGFENYGWLSRMFYDAFSKGYMNGIMQYSGDNPEDVTLFRDAHKRLMDFTFDQKDGTEKRMPIQAQDAVARLIGFCVYLSRDYKWDKKRNTFNPVDAVFKNISEYNLFMKAQTEAEGWKANKW